MTYFNTFIDALLALMLVSAPFWLAPLCALFIPYL